MVTAVATQSSGPVSNPGRGHCLFIYIGTGEFNAEGNAWPLVPYAGFTHAPLP